MSNSPIKLILSKFPNAKKGGKGWTACCPAHEDASPSLSIGEGDDGRVLLKCHTGCSPEQVVDAIGLRMSDLYAKKTSDGRFVKNKKPKKRSQYSQKSSSTVVSESSSENIENSSDKPKSSTKRKIIATYNYQNEQGKLLFQVVRYDPKDFRQRQPKEDGDWNWSVSGVQKVPYRLPELLAEPESKVYIVEGEKDVDCLRKIGVLATCNAGGAGEWTDKHSKFLNGREVVILPDNDEAGLRHAQKVASGLQGIARAVYILELPGLPPKGDPSDWVNAGGTRNQLEKLQQLATCDRAASEDSWPELRLFEHWDLPEFPVDALPHGLRDWVAAESHATQTPVDLAAWLALSVCSAAIAGRVEVEPHLGWKEPVNLFSTVILEPGNRKSAVFSDATKPLRELEEEVAENARPEIARKKSYKRQAEARLKKLENKAGDLKSDSNQAEFRKQAEDLAEEIDSLADEVLPQLIVSDVTCEMLAIILQQQGGRIASMSPEGNVFDLMAGRYSKNNSNQFDVYLNGHSGDDLKIDRVTRESVFVKKPALTCAYTIQPQVIKALADQPAFRGCGLLGRFFYAVPTSWLGKREITPMPVSEELHRHYNQKVRELYHLQWQSPLRLDVKASKAFYEWQAKIEQMLGDGDRMELLRDWGGKLAGATVRIAAVMHAVDHGAKSIICESTIRAAIQIAEYAIPHAELVLEKMAMTIDSDYADAHYIWKWVIQEQKREFSKRDVHQHGRRRFPYVDDLDGPLEDLAQRGYIRLLPKPPAKPGRPPSPSYEVNPLALKSAKPRKRSQNSHNPSRDSGVGSIEDIENSFRKSPNDQSLRSPAPPPSADYSSDPLGWEEQTI